MNIKVRGIWNLGKNTTEAMMLGVEWAVYMCENSQDTDKN